MPPSQLAEAESAFIMDDLTERRKAASMGCEVKTAEVDLYLCEIIPELKQQVPQPQILDPQTVRGTGVRVPDPRSQDPGPQTVEPA